MPIQKTSAVIKETRLLTPTACEVTLTPREPMPFLAGQFVNVFREQNGVKVRRAYSITSDTKEPSILTLSIRYLEGGSISPFFFSPECVGKTVELMGPLGINTADKITKSRVFLFGFGIGAGVIRSVALDLIKRPSVTSITIMTGSRDESDIVHKDFFDALKESDPRVSVTYVITDPGEDTTYPRGYIQNHLSGLDFNDADIYVCGQTVACDALIETVRQSGAIDFNTFIESFG